MSARAKYDEMRRIILETPAEVREATEDAITLCRHPGAGADGPAVEKLLRWWYMLHFAPKHGALFGGEEPHPR